MLDAIIFTVECFGMGIGVLIIGTALLIGIDCRNVRGP